MKVETKYNLNEGVWIVLVPCVENYGDAEVEYVTINKIEVTNSGCVYYVTDNDGQSRSYAEGELFSTRAEADKRLYEGQLAALRNSLKDADNDILVWRGWIDKMLEKMEKLRNKIAWTEKRIEELENSDEHK